MIFDFNEWNYPFTLVNKGVCLTSFTGSTSTTYAVNIAIKGHWNLVIYYMGNI